MDRRGKVNLFIRPRRFGKTLNLSMLQYFFENTEYTLDGQKNKDLFEGLAIMQTGKEYIKHMGIYPVISLSLKSAKQKNFKEAFACLKEVIAKEYGRYERVVEERLKTKKI